MKVINSDDGFERYAKQAGLDLKKMGSFTAAQTKKTKTVQEIRGVIPCATIQKI